MSKEEACRLKSKDDKCSIVTVDSDSDENLDCFITGVSVKKENISYVVIDSDSDDEHRPKKKRPKIHEISIKDKSQKVSGTNKRLTQGPPILITDDDDDDDDDDLENPVVIKDDLRDQDQIVKNEKKKNEFAVFQHKLSSVAAVKERKKRKSSKKEPKTVKSEKSEPGNSQCKIPGCFFQGLENLKQYSGKNYKQNKDELVQKIYALLNSSVFDQKMPEKIDIKWNKKMLRTAGLCTTGELRYPKRQRYAKIQISLKVCDSADRLRDTLIHEICHAASWLLDGNCDSHGDVWRYYARKSNMVHPELLKVTRCHDYKINYKIHYECTQCKFRVGRHSRSLDTTRLICPKCRGSLVLLPLTRKDGTPIQPHVRPFAKYVQENYRKVKKETEGITHGDVIRKLSKDFLAKKQSQVL